MASISETEIARLIVETLHLDVSPADVDHGAPLFGEGLGLDSIDMLEIALSVSKKYGLELRSEDRAAFASVRALTAHIEQHRTK
ncbi:phosphopantetheine-binding protein [Nitrospira sp. Nam80]